MQSLPRHLLAAFFLALALGGAALFVAGGLSDSPDAPSTATLFPEPRALPAFRLRDQSDRPFTLDDLRGRTSLLFFGFTHCPDICPAELQVMSAALDELGADADEVVPIFITLDPERDTPEAVSAYVANFGDNLVGLTGSPEQIAKAAKAYRVSYQKFQDESMGNDYSIDHSALVYLMGPDGKFITHIPYGTPPDKMAETLRRYL
jgi:protein SCO1/2